MNAVRLTLDAPAAPLVTPEKWRELTTPPDDADTTPDTVPDTDDDGTLSWALRNGRCCVHRDRPGHAESGSFASYCNECHGGHERQWRHL